MGIVTEGSRVSNLGFRGIRIRNSHSTRMATATAVIVAVSSCHYYLLLLLQAYLSGMSQRSISPTVQISPQKGFSAQIPFRL